MSKSISPEQKKLNEKIANLKLESKLNLAVAKKLKHIKASVLSVGQGTTFLSVKAANTEELKTVLAEYPPINKTTKIGSSKDDIEIETPFKLTIKNPASPNQWSAFELNIRWTAKEMDIWLHIPLEVIKDFVHSSKRKIYDSEYVHFIGISETKLREMAVLCYTFNCRKIINWYGGDVTLTEPEEVDTIMDFLKS